MKPTKTRSAKLWEEIEQHHLELFEKCQKEFDKLQGEASKEINARFKDCRKEFEEAVLEIRHITRRMDGAELNWKEERRLMEDRVNADRKATETRLAAERSAAEARLAAADARFERELDKSQREFASQKRWLIANFVVVLLGVLALITTLFVSAMPNQPPPFVF